MQAAAENARAPSLGAPPAATDPRFERLTLIATYAREVSRASGVAVSLEQVGVFRCCARDGDMAPDLGVEVGQSGIAAEAIRCGQTLVVADSDHDARVNRDAARSLGARSIALVPVRDGERTIGLLAAFSAASGAFDDLCLRQLHDAALEVGCIVAEPKQAPPPLSEEPPSLSPPIVPPPMFSNWRKAFAGGLLGIVIAATALIVSGRPSFTAVTGLLQRAQSSDQLEAEANAGDADAEYRLGLRYFDASRPEHDDTRALAWIGRAASAGLPAAQSMMAKLLFSATAPPQQRAQALAWCVIARANGDASAGPDIANLARQLGADELAEARYDIGSMYEAGVGVQRSYPAAYAWYSSLQVSDRRRAASLKRLQSLMPAEELRRARGKHPVAEGSASQDF